MRSLRSAVALGLVTAVAGVASAQSVAVRGAALARVTLAQRIAADPEVLKAVRTKNDSGETNDEIQRKDREWTRSPQYPLRKSLAGGPCAQHLRELTKPDSSIVEVILMDKNGANVCVFPETTDYWQGDEPKFQKTFTAGKDVFVDDPRLDESTNVYSIQLSVPVVDGGKRTGALTLGLRVSK